MGKRHLRAVTRIEKESHSIPWTRSTFEIELATPSTRGYWVAEVDGDVVGHAGLMMVLDEGHITTIAVDSRWRRKYVASALLLEVARDALRRGATALTLEVRISNNAAQDLYRRFGFAPVGARKAYYADTGEDAIVMWVHDIGGDEYKELLESMDRTRVTGAVSSASQR